MARPIFVNETETEPLQSPTNKTKPRLIPLESCKRDRDSYLFSLASKTETEISLKWSCTQDRDQDYTNVGFIKETGHQG